MSFNTGFFISQPSTGDFNIYRMSFDGVNEYITIPNNILNTFSNTQAFSISCEVKFTNYLATNPMISTRNASNRGLDFWFFSGYLYVSLFNAAGNSIVVTIDPVFYLTNNIKYTLAFSYDGSGTAAGVKIYINGINIVTTIVADTLTGTIANSDPTYIGFETLATAYTLGEIGTIRVWDTELTAGEFLTDYNSGVVINNSIKPLNRVFGFRGGQNAQFGTQWTFPDESGNIDNPVGYSVNMEFADRTLVP